MKKRGFTILEVLVAASIISISLYGVLITVQNFLKISRDNLGRTQGALLAAEGVEALRLIRDRGWTNNIATLNTDTTYWLAWNAAPPSGGSATREATTTKIFIDDYFERSFVVEDVYRDDDDDIAPSGTLDPDTRKFSVTVSWKLPARATSTASVSTYLTNFFND